MEYRVKIWHDECAECPFLNWDCEPSVIWSFYNDMQGNFDSVITELNLRLTQGMLKRYSKKILEIMDLSCCIEYNFNERVGEIFLKLEHLKVTQYAQLCKLLKIPHYLHSSRGYSQGDYTDVLIVITKEDINRVGFNVKDWLKDDTHFKSVTTLFDNWVWGDTYGFTIEELKKYTKIYKDGETEECEEWEQIDSCGGFYGYDIKENGMLEYIPTEYNINIDDVIRE